MGSLFKTIANVAKGFIGVGDEQSGFSLVPSTISAGANIFSAILSIQANKDATQRFLQAQELREQAIREGNQEALALLDGIIEQTAPAIQGLREVAARDPHALTPGQEIDLADARRTTANRLATTGARGSGRSEVAAIRDVEGRLKGDFVDTNLARQERSLNQLAGQGFAAQRGQASIAAGQGPQIADITRESGLARAGEELAQGRLRGQAIADIGSVAAEAAKRRTRETTPTTVI